MKLNKSMKKVIFYEGDFDQHKGKFLNSLIKYKKNEIIGIYSPKPTYTLKDYLSKQKIKLFNSIDKIPPAKELIIADLHFDKEDLSDKIKILEKLLSKGLIIINGGHFFLKPYFPKYSKKIVDLRDNTSNQCLFKGSLFKKKYQKRILTVGMDCNIGKMTASLEIYKYLKENGFDIKFIATGQIGMTIRGEGIPLDRSIVDFTSGFLEQYITQFDNDFLIIEGQGSLFTPLYSGLAVAQIHGSVPDYLILCIDPTRISPRYFPNINLPPIKVAIKQYEEIAKLVNPKAKCIAICVNSSKLTKKEGEEYIKNLQKEISLPVFDPIQQGCSKILKELL